MPQTGLIRSFLQFHCEESPPPQDLVWMKNSIVRVVVVASLGFCLLTLFFATRKGLAAPTSVNDLLEELRFGNRDFGYCKLLASVTKTDLSILRRALGEERSESVIWRLAIVIGRTGSPDAVPDLLPLLEHDAYRVRRYALHALAEIGSPEALPAVIKALQNDPEESVRMKAAVALRAIGTPEAIAALEQARESDTLASVRTTARWLLLPPAGDAPAEARPGEVAEGSLRDMRYLIYTPTTYKKDAAVKLLVSVHGTGGNPESYLNLCKADAERLGMMALAPWFDYEHFPAFGELNIGPYARRADLALLELVDDLGKRLGVDASAFYLFGHSQGGQFTHRFTVVHGERVIRAAACASGHYLQFDENSTFPHALRPTSFAPDVDLKNLRSFFETPMILVIGDRDENYRLRGADRFLAEGEEYAQSRRWPFLIQKTLVEGGGHSGRSNYPAAAAFLFAAD